MPLRLAYAALLGISSITTHAAVAQPTTDPALGIELAAARDFLSRFRPRSLTIDSVLVAANEAPPSLTRDRRPGTRHRLLADSLTRFQVAGGSDSLMLRASAPLISRTGATISMTLSGRLGAGHPRGGFYETIVFTLRRTDNGWVVTQRSQLGIS